MTSSILNPQLLESCLNFREHTQLTEQTSKYLRRRKWLVATVTCCALLIAGAVQAQGFLHEVGDATPGPQEQATLSQTTPQNPISTQTDALWRDVSWISVPRNILHDQKDIWLFPVQLAHGHHWVPTLVVIGVTAGLLAADAHDAHYFRQTTAFNGFNKAASSNITSIGMAVVPLTFYGVGLLRKDTYAQKTAIFVGEAVIDSFVVYGVMNAVTRRDRPLDVAQSGIYSDTFFHSSKLLTGSSFPSGHTIAAFSIATVFANRYKNHRWVPWVAYGAACMIGFSRITLGEHFPSDVFLGAALGYSITHFVVLRGQ
jgi:membrane-associated phospholipid phosphatase